MKKLGLLFFIFCFCSLLYFGQKSLVVKGSDHLRVPASPLQVLSVETKNDFFDASDLVLKDVETKAVYFKGAALDLEGEDFCVGTMANFFNTTLELQAEGMATSGDIPALKITTFCENLAQEIPVFLEMFCQSSIYELGRMESPYRDFQYKFENLLDGFPRSWHLQKISVELAHGGVEVLEPSLEEKQNKFHISCDNF